jgi:hypothetical protein
VYFSVAVRSNERDRIVGQTTAFLGGANRRWTNRLWLNNNLVDGWDPLLIFNPAFDSSL